MKGITTTVTLGLLLMLSGCAHHPIVDSSGVSGPVQASEVSAQSTLGCTSMPTPSGQKYTCSLGRLKFSHDKTGVEDAFIEGVRFQFTVDRAGTGPIETIVEGSAKSIAWQLQLNRFDFIYIDATNISRPMGSLNKIEPSKFNCNWENATAFRSSGVVERARVVDWLNQGSITVSVATTLYSGVPGTGC